MEWIYNANMRTIRKNEDNSKEIELTEVESRFVEIVSNGLMNSWGEMMKYVYGYSDKYSYRTLATIKSRVNKKVKFNFKVIRKYGIRLLDHIYIE